MKRIVVAVLIFLFGLAVAYALPRPRFEHVLTERTNDTDDSLIGRFEVWHDRETGQEIVCPAGMHGNVGPVPYACYLTGRKWDDR